MNGDDWNVFGFDRYERERSDARWVDPSRRNEKHSHPYSYSEFFIFGNRSIIRQHGISGDYSDRLREWNSEKFTEAAEPFHKRFDQFSADDASKFLTTYYGKPLRCVALAEGCNVGNGFPYWIFWYEEAKG